MVLEKYRLLTTPPTPSMHPSGRRTESSSPRSLTLSSPNRVVIEKYHSSDSTSKEQSVRPSSVSPVEGHPPQPVLAQAVSTSAASELVWLTEMEKGYDTLVDAIYPYISDVAVLSLGRTIVRSFSSFEASNSAF